MKKSKNIKSSKEELINALLEIGKVRFVNALANLNGVEFVNSYIELLKISKSKSLDVKDIIEQLDTMKFI